MKSGLDRQWSFMLQSTNEGDAVFYVVDCKNQVTRGRQHRAGFGDGVVSPVEKNWPPENRPRSELVNSPYSWNPQSVVLISNFTAELTASGRFCDRLSILHWSEAIPEFLAVRLGTECYGDAKQQLTYTSLTLQSGLALRKTLTNDLESSLAGREVAEVAILPRVLRLSVERIRRVASGPHSSLFRCLVVCVVRSLSPDCRICRLRYLVSRPEVQLASSTVWV